MEAMSQLARSSPLNPNAPLFVPMAYRTVEDYSEQWFALVQTSPWFRDYWLRERFQDPQLSDDLDDDPLLPDVDALFEDYSAKEEEKNQNHCSDLVSMAVLRWRRGRGVAEAAPRYVEKAPRRVSVRVSPRTIQQPR